MRHRGELLAPCCGSCGIFECDASTQSQHDDGEDAGGDERVGGDDEHAGPTTSGDRPDAVDLDAWDPSIWAGQGSHRAGQAADDLPAVSDLDDGELSLTAHPARQVETFSVFCMEDPSPSPRRAWGPSLTQQQLLEARYSASICGDAVIALGQHGMSSPVPTGTSAASISCSAEPELEVIDFSSSDAVLEAQLSVAS